MFRLFRRPSLPSTVTGARFHCATDVTARSHPGGAVFLHSGRGLVFSCNEAGARIWESLREGRPVEEIALDLARKYGVPTETTKRDALRFIGQMVTAGIVRREGRHETGV